VIHHTSAPRLHGPWQLLGASRGADALAMFQARIAADPANARARVGAAIAYAQAGRFGLSVQMMREAVYHDTAVLGTLPLDEDLRRVIRRHRYTMIQRTGDRAFATDAYFAAGACDVILGHHAEALLDRAEAIAAGDRSPTTRTLYHEVAAY